MNNDNTIPTICSLATLLPSHLDTTNLFAFGPDGDKHWPEFIKDVEVCSSWLSTRSEPRWAICIQDSYLFAVAFFSLCYANKQLILPGNHQPEAIRELSNNFDALLHDELLASFQSVVIDNIALLTIESTLLTAIPEKDKQEKTCFLELNLDKINLTLFTSGSSGSPKAIEKTLSHIDCELSQLEQIWGKQIGNCRIHSTVSHQHIYGLLFRLMWPISTQRPFSRINLDYPEQVASHGDQDAVLISSPALLKRLGQEKFGEPYRTIFSSGGPLSLEAANQTHTNLGHLPYEVFGSTETGGIGYRQQHAKSTPWQLFPEVKARLNAEGCIALLSKHINPTKWYQTCDQCELHDDGTFQLKGRTDRVIKIEEKRISLVEVEKRLQQLIEIEEAVVIAIESPKRLELVAAIVLNEVGHQQLTALGRGPFWIEIRHSLRQWLEPIAIPRRYRILDEIPLNSQGKRLIRDIESLF